MTKKLNGNLLLVAIAVSLGLLVGCSTPKPIPSTYLQGNRQAAVAIDKISPKAVMADSGQGGLLGALITGTSRASNMKAKLAGLQGETVAELMRQAISQRMEPAVKVSEEKKDLLVEVQVMHWGWFVPTTVAGIKTGGYQCQVSGTCTAYDLTLPGKKSKQLIAFSPILVAQNPLGNDPEKLPESAVKEIMLKTVDDFSGQVATYLTAAKGKPVK